MPSVTAKDCGNSSRIPEPNSFSNVLQVLPDGVVPEAQAGVCPNLLRDIGILLWVYQVTEEAIGLL